MKVFFSSFFFIGNSCVITSLSRCSLCAEHNGHIALPADTDVGCKVHV